LYNLSLPLSSITSNKDFVEKMQMPEKLTSKHVSDLVFGFKPLFENFLKIQ
jgi:hypothetical protein